MKDVPLRLGVGGPVVGIATVHDDGSVTLHDLNRPVREVLLKDTAKHLSVTIQDDYIDCGATAKNAETRAGM